MTTRKSLMVRTQNRTCFLAINISPTGGSTAGAIMVVEVLGLIENEQISLFSWLC